MSLVVAGMSGVLICNYAPSICCYFAQVSLVKEVLNFNEIIWLNKKNKKLKKRKMDIK